MSQIQSEKEQRPGLKVALEVVQRIYSVIPQRIQRKVYICVLMAQVVALMDIFVILRINSQLREGATGQDLTFVVEGLLIVLVMATRSGFSLFITWKLRKISAAIETQLGVKNIEGFLRSPKNHKRFLAASELTEVADIGPAVAAGVLVTSLILIVVEVLTIGLLSTTIFVVYPVGGGLAIAYFLATGYLAIKLITNRTMVYGSGVVNIRSSAYGIIEDVFGLKAELTQSPTSTNIFRRFVHQRTSLSENRAKLQFLESVPKYIGESFVLVGLLVVVGCSYLIDGNVGLRVSTGIFSVAILRVLPGVVRIQGYVASILSSAPEVNKNALISWPRSDKVMTSDAQFELLSSLIIGDNGSRLLTISQNVVIPNQGLLLIYGNSGAGKTTLLEVLSGLRKGSSNSVRISEAVRSHIAYVPTTPYFSKHLSLRDNLTVLKTTSEDDEAFMISSLHGLGLPEFTSDSKMQSIDCRPSSGEVRRLCLLRSVLTKPLVLICDEPLASLDRDAATKVETFLCNLAKDICVIVSAHDPSSFRSADLLIQIEHGQVEQVTKSR